MNRSATDSFLQARASLMACAEDIESARAAFAWPALDGFNWALDYFDVMAHGNDAPALWIVEEDGREERVSFAQLSERSNRVAHWLQQQGIRRGDRVLLMLNNERPLWECMLALIKLGAELIPATPLLAGDDLLDRFERGHVKHVVVGSAHVEKFNAVPSEFTRIAVGAPAAGWLRYADAHEASPAFVREGHSRPHDPLLLYFTSGTTSKPKLVMHSHQSYPVGHLSTMYWLGLRPGDLHLNISSPGWAKHAWSCFFAPWNAGACVFIYNYARFDARGLLDVLVGKGVTSLCAPPTVWRMLIQQNLGEWPVSLRSVGGAGEPMNPEVIDQVREAWGLTLRDGFGQSETTCVVGNPPGLPVKPGSMGRPLPGYRVVLLDAEGQPAEEGELCLDLSERPIGLMLGYEGDDEKTAQATHGGFYRTGDVARRDEDGHYFYVGRADDVFKSSDYRISPFEIESVLIEHPDVVEAAVIPSPDPMRLAVPKAVVVLRDGVQPGPELAESILAFCRARLAPYKRVRRLAFGPLPKTISGKIQRALLRREEAAQVSAGTRGQHEYHEEDFPSLARR